MTHEEFKRYCNENNYVPLTTELYSQTIRRYEALDKIWTELKREIDTLPSSDYKAGMIIALDIVEKYAN